MRTSGSPLMVSSAPWPCERLRTQPTSKPIETDAKVAMIDDCDPDDPAWAPVGCLQERGDVTARGVGLFLRSPLDAQRRRSVHVGHSSWRNDPSHLVVKNGERMRMSNEGGRQHTFTKVAEFGGGRVPPLLVGTQLAPECALAPGATDPSRSPRATNSS